ncbi:MULTISPECIES: periplasmic heavy metal sensor [Caulobacter]|jgi:hypothetical protein|uniref:Uncharacterized protein n=1 Tax=Caulobacter vibrioides OR37 TaxID=1292034 RepID=R0ELU1_CAUVI|nr:MULTISPECIES: periplasmic heavy metal sensor [Caulobacter]ENZ82884.1 hypothetical protein OR37_01078 [Caulobacter vibrioides OR37]
MSRANWTRMTVGAAIAGAVGAVVVSGAHWLLQSAHPKPMDLHQELHELVPLSPQEQARLQQREDAYQARRRAIEQRVKAANGRLARAIALQPGWTPEVEAASKEVESAAAELERATLQHVVEMREGLDAQHRPAYDAALVKALSDGAK